MLKKRILTAAVLLPAVVMSILWMPSKIFAVFSGMIFLLALWEWTALAGFSSFVGRVGCFVATPILALALLSVLSILGREVLEKGLFGLVISFWFLALIALFRYPRDGKFWKSRIVGVFVGCIILLPAWAFLVALQYEDPKWVLYVLTLIWLADTAAYFSGKHFGKHKLAMKVSPGKTWEGVLGAFLFTLPVVFFAFDYLKPDISRLSWAILGLGTVFFAIVGDLFESLFKRFRQVKDSGTLLPGHGGVLDRIDSITSAIPVFVIGFILLR